MSPEPDDDYPLLVDRRRQPRVPVSSDLRATIPVVTNGEVIEISATGALMSTPVRLGVGDRARLSLLLGREPFGAWVRVVRSEEGTRMGRIVRYHLGLTFTSLDDQSRQVLDRFVREPPARP
jgi:hypothetical protein